MAFSSRARRVRGAGGRHDGRAHRGARPLAIEDPAQSRDRDSAGRVFALLRGEGALPRHRHVVSGRPARRAHLGVFDRIVTFLLAVWSASGRMVGIIYRYRRMLAAITKIELAKRHAGSVLGTAWVVLQPALLLSVYIFVYMVVLRMRFEGFSRFDYVLFVFCGLVPYLGFMEALTTGALSIKQNIHLVKNVMLPIELIPVRSVIV